MRPLLPNASSGRWRQTLRLHSNQTAIQCGTPAPDCSTLRSSRLRSVPPTPTPARRPKPVLRVPGPLALQAPQTTTQHARLVGIGDSAAIPPWAQVPQAMDTAGKLHFGAWPPVNRDNGSPPRSCSAPDYQSPKRPKKRAQRNRTDSGLLMEVPSPLHFRPKDVCQPLRRHVLENTIVQGPRCVDHGSNGAGLREELSHRVAIAHITGHT